MDLATILIKIEGITVREMEGETIFLDPDETSIHVADEVGGFIYRQFDGKKTLEHVLQSILNEYEVDRITAETDLFNFVHNLMAQKIVKAL